MVRPVAFVQFSLLQGILQGKVLVNALTIAGVVLATDQTVSLRLVLRSSEVQSLIGGALALCLVERAPSECRFC
jgi:hypothetical protein